MAIGITFTFRDRKGKESTTVINVPSDLAMPSLIDFAQQAAAIVSQLTRGALVRVGITIGVDISSVVGVSSEAFEDADVEEKAYFSFLTTNGFRTRVNLPTLNEGKVVDGSDQLDLNDLDVQTFVDMMLDGLSVDDGAAGTITVTPVDKRGEELVALLEAREKFVAS